MKFRYLLIAFVLYFVPSFAFAYVAYIAQAVTGLLIGLAVASGLGVPQQWPPLNGSQTDGVQSADSSGRPVRNVPRGRPEPAQNGWVDPNTPPSPVSKATVLAGWKYFYLDGVACSVPVGASDIGGCASWAPYTICTPLYSGSPGGVLSGSCAGSPTLVWTLTPIEDSFTSCASGYIANAVGTCSLIDSSVVKWPSDGSPTLVSDNSGNMLNHPRESDIADGTSSPGVGTATVSSTTQDQYGNPVRETIKGAPSGGYHYETQTQIGNDSVVQGFDVASDGTITNQVYNTYNNTTVNDQPNVLNLAGVATEGTLQGVKSAVTSSNSWLQSIRDVIDSGVNTLRLSVTLVENRLSALYDLVADISTPVDPPPSVVPPPVGLPLLANPVLPSLGTAGGGVSLGGGCPAPIAISIMARSYSIDFFGICSSAETLSHFFMAFAWLIAIRNAFSSLSATV